ncbi:PA2169 family four-helix-bundle protein [Pricia sp. S334]|uniref:PA2169 family four-helix-bundle protein n=1 Tax=Pricia mediterranea TaxID=3076079 RepID=A0ABU3L2B7_9FLAO|nr:PA2169 family four-helix-bundle protein [Pricia sp. S334]MDT7827775.1 PA2169 family four-helix-bundle protein [Pricia sp. S334]
MSKDKSKILDEIEEILEKNEDARKGYEKAADNADSNALAGYFREKASKRREFNTKLKHEIKDAYPDFDEDGSFTGSMHRAWMDVKSLFSADDDESMLEESIKGDKAAIDEYNDVIEYDNLAPGLKTLLISQRDEIQRDIAQNDSLESLH